MEPRENSALSGESSVQPEVIVKEVPVADTPKRLFLFHYVTMLVSGLILVSLLSFTGFAVLDHWLGEQGPANIFNSFEYYAYLYLLVSLIVVGALHVWMRVRVGSVLQEDYPAVKVFRTIFLTILTLTILGSIGTMVYVGVDMLLGTGDYSAKSTWLIMLNSLQVIVWAALLWWYFKQSRAMAIAYVAAVGAVVSVMAVLLLVLPVFSKRDAVIDARTTSDLSAIVAKISEYTKKNNKLPASLSDVKLDDKVASRVEKYEYQPGQAAAPKSAPTTLEDYLDYSSSSSSSSFSYKLCANFKTDTTKNEDDITFLSYFGGSSTSEHPSGRHCFDHTAYGGTGDDGGIEPAEPLQSILKPTSSSPVY